MGWTTYTSTGFIAEFLNHQHPTVISCFKTAFSSIDSMRIVVWLTLQTNASKLSENGSQNTAAKMEKSNWGKLSSLKLTVRTWKQAGPHKETIVFQASIFRCENVSFREVTLFWLNDLASLKLTGATPEIFGRYSLPTPSPIHFQGRGLLVSGRVYDFLIVHQAQCWWKWEDSKVHFW